MPAGISGRVARGQGELPGPLSRWRPTSTRALHAAFLLVLAWAVAYVRSRPGSQVRDELFVAGIALLGVTAVGALTAWSATRQSTPVVDETNATASEDETEIPLSAIEDDDRLRWADAAWRAATSLARSGSLPAPEVAVVRVTASGVELLLYDPCPVAPAPFRAGAGGLVWTLEPSMGLVEITALPRKVPSEPDDAPVALIEIGRDDEGRYFVDAGGFFRIRIDDDDPGELGDAFPSPGYTESADTQTPFGAPLLGVERGDELLLEPFGLHLTIAPESTAASGANRSQEIAQPSIAPEPIEEGEEEGIDPDASSDDVFEVEVQPAGLEMDLVHPDGLSAEELAPPGRVEVRILRETPDLVGELLTEATAGAVEFVAYLALHGYHAPTAKLKDAIGTARSQASRSGKTVWTSAGEARRALGADVVPAASGNLLYELSREVTCDWTRFQALVDLARSKESDPRRRREALVAALEIVEGVPALGSRRFGWFDTEGLLSDIGLLVGLAARELTKLATDAGDAELRAWALRKAKLLLPGADVTDAPARSRTPAVPGSAR